jgi:hypothetical protein
VPISTGRSRLALFKYEAQLVIRPSQHPSGPLSGNGVGQPMM